MRLALALPVGILALGTAASAQFGLPTGFRVDNQLTSGNNGGLGVARTNIAGQERFWVTSRAASLTTGSPHVLYEYDRAGTLLATYNQPILYGTGNTWGMRDLAFDGTHLYGGSENAANGNRVFAFDAVNRVWDPSRDIVLSAPAFAITRALTYVPSTDTFWTSNFGGTCFEFNRAGATVRTFAATANSIYGLGYDPVLDEIIAFGQTGGPPAAPNRATGLITRVIDRDAGAGTPAMTTIMGLGDATIPGAPPGGIAGGMEVYDLGGVRHAVYLSQATSDTFYEANLQYQFSLGPSSYLAGSNGLPNPNRDGDDAPYFGNGLWGLDMSSGTAGAGQQGIVFLTLSTTPFALPLGGILGFPAGSFALLNLGTSTIIGNVGLDPVTGQGRLPIPIPGAVGPLALPVCFQVLIICPNFIPPPFWPFPTWLIWPVVCS